MSPPPASRRVLVPVYLSTVGTWAAFALVLVVLPFRFQELGLSVLQYGVALAVYALGTLATEGLWGYLAFRLASPKALGALGLATAASLLALGYARSFVEVVVVLGIYGALVVYSTPLLRWVGMTAPGPGKASRGLGRLGLFFGIGLSSGTAAGPLIYSVAGFRMDVWVATALFALATVPLLRVRWSTFPLPRARAPGQGALRALAKPQFVLAISLVVVYFMVYTLVTNFLQYYSIDLFHGTVKEVGYVLGGARAVALICGVVLGSVVDRWGARRAAPLGFALLAGGAVATWLSQDYTEMTLATLLLAVGSGWLSVTLLPLALARILPANQGTAVGVFGSFEDLGLILGPLLLSATYSAWGARSLFPVAAGLASAALVVALVSQRSGPDRTLTGDGPPRPLPEEPRD